MRVRLILLVTRLANAISRDKAIAAGGHGRFLWQVLVNSLLIFSVVFISSAWMRSALASQATVKTELIRTSVLMTSWRLLNDVSRLCAMTKTRSRYYLKAIESSSALLFD